jgi:hypothetical protein
LTIIGSLLALSSWSQALFAWRRIRASRAKGRALCGPIIARLARFLITLVPKTKAAIYHRGLWLNLA